MRQCVPPRKKEREADSPAPSLLLKQSPIFIVAGNHDQIPDFRTHCHEQNTAILVIHKNENEASTFRAYETRFHIAKFTPFPFVSLKSIYLICAPDKRNRVHSGHIGSLLLFFFFSNSLPYANFTWECYHVRRSMLLPLMGSETNFRTR